MPGFDSAGKAIPSEHDLLIIEDDATARRRAATIGRLITTLHPDNARWDDLRFPATAINPPGQASDPDWDVSNGGWLFDSGSTEVLYLIAQLPHTWSEGTTLKPHVHWEKTTSAAGDVLWQLRYEWASIGEVRSALVTINEATAAVASDVADTHQITALGDISGAGRGISDMLVMRIERVGGNAGDTYGADARLLEFDIHHQVDARGSAEEFAK